MSNAKAAKAFVAMKALGISEKKVKPVLKNLLKLYDKNWALIEDENYRVLADAIFEVDESKADEPNEDAQLHDDSGPPLKRLRLRHQKEQASGSGESSCKRPKMDGSDLLQNCPREETTEMLQSYSEERNFGPDDISPQMHLPDKHKEQSSPHACLVNEGVEPTPLHFGEKRTGSETVSPRTRLRNKGKEPLVPPEDGYRQEREDPSRLCLRIREKGAESDTVSNQVHHRDTRNEPIPSQIVPRQKKLVSGGPSSVIYLKQPKIEPDIDMLPQENLASCDQNNASTNPKTVPSAADFPLFETPVAVIHPPKTGSALDQDPLHKKYCLVGNGSDEKSDDQELVPPNQYGVSRCEIGHCLELADIPEESPANVEIASSISGEVVIPQVPRLDALNGLEDIHGIVQQSKEVPGNIHDEMDQMKLQTHPESSNSSELAILLHQKVDAEDIRPHHDVNDLSKGEENLKISFANEVSSEPYPPLFHYIPQNIVHNTADVKFSLARIGGEHCCSNCFGDCLSSSIPCECARETGGDFAYTLEGLVKEKFLDECISMNRDTQQRRLFYCDDCPAERCKNEDLSEPCKGHIMRKFIKECWSKCGCNKQCGNRVVQRGITCNLQVFLTPDGKGWGLRALEDLPRGTFVCEYAGEIITSRELYERNVGSTNRDTQTYPVMLDADWGSEVFMNDKKALYLDATFYGNVGRFINHSCFDANLVEIPVEVETPDHHYYHLAFFTTRKVDALEELTWDYGIDFDVHNHDTKGFRCRCGGKCCRDMKRPRKMKHTPLILR